MEGEIKMTINNDRRFFFFKQLGNLSFRLFVASYWFKKHAVCLFVFFVRILPLLTSNSLGVLMKIFIPITFPVGHWLSVHELTTAHAFIYVFIFLNQASIASNLLWIINVRFNDGICCFHL